MFPNMQCAVQRRSGGSMGTGMVGEKKVERAESEKTSARLSSVGRQTCGSREWTLAVLRAFDRNGNQP